MKSLCVVLLSLLSLGFIIETPESRREEEQKRQAWQKQVVRTFDLAALRQFLVAQIDTIREVDGVTLAKSRIDSKWHFTSAAASCGDWLLFGDLKSAEFTLEWTYSDVPHPDGSGGVWKMVVLKCRRDGRDRFRFLSATRSEDEYVVLLP